MPRRNRSAGERPQLPQLPPLPQINHTQGVPPQSPGARITPSMTRDQRQDHG